MGINMATLSTILLLLFAISLDEITGNEETASDRKRVRQYPPPCSSEIYCHGDLLHTVQMAQVYKDSKTFVDRKLLGAPKSVREKFDAFMKSVSNKPTRNQTRKFVEDNFVDASKDFEAWTPPDWTPSPSFVESIKDENLREYALQLNAIWKTLGRQIDQEVEQNKDEFSLVYVPNPFMVPGGRFAEFYYWDQYWILKGMLLCEMKDSVRGMIENFMFMARTMGYVPNGGRIYYERTQPPLLIPMVKDYIQATGNLKFLQKHLSTMDKEFHFWMKNRTVVINKKGKSYRLARYNNELTGPRPESYREDFELATHFQTQQEKDEIYINLKSGAESGWDFSSRWFVPNDTSTVGTLRDIKARYIIPVDLNAFLYNNARIMASFHRKFNHTGYARYYDSVAAVWRQAINDILWDDALGCWFDYDLLNRRLRKEFYPSNITPLWANITSRSSKLRNQGHTVYREDDTVERVVHYLKNSGAMKFPGGVPTSMEHTGEQWDFPNGWAPLQHLVVEALRHTQSSEAQSLAFSLAQRWVYNNYLTFINSNNTMFEKYDVQSVGSPGGGGEYEVVAGFGWSNGVVFDFLHTYAASLSSNNSSSNDDYYTY